MYRFAPHDLFVRFPAHLAAPAVYSSCDRRDRLDALTPLVNCVENGKVPRRIVAGRMDSGRIVRTRPLCPYPETARYDSQGSLDEAQSFTCRQDGIGDSLLLGGLGESGC